MLGPFLPLCRALGRARDRARRGRRRSTASRSSTSGRIAERDTPPARRSRCCSACSPATPRRTSTRSTRPSIAAERGIELVETTRTSARDFTDLVRVTVVCGRAARARRRHDARPPPPPAPARGLGPALQPPARGPPRAVPLPRRAGHDRPRRHGLRRRTASTSTPPPSATSPTTRDGDAEDGEAVMVVTTDDPVPQALDRRDRRLRRLPRRARGPPRLSGTARWTACPARAGLQFDATVKVSPDPAYAVRRPVRVRAPHPEARWRWTRRSDAGPA